MRPLHATLAKLSGSLPDHHKLPLVGSAVFFGIIGLAFFLVYQNAGIMIEQITDDFNQQQLILARRAASQIDADLGDIEIEIASLASHYRAMDAASRHYGLTTLYEHMSSKGVMAVGVMGEDGAISDLLHDAQTPSADLPKGSEDCPELSGGRRQLGPLHVRERAADRAIVTSLLCAPVDARDEQREALFAVIDVSRLVSRAAQDVRSGRTGYAWAIDTNGLFLYHPEREFIGRSAFEARKERGPYISFSEINRIMKDRMLLGEEGTGRYVSGWHRGVEGQISKLISFTPVRSSAIAPGHSWSLAVVAPTTEVADAVRRVYLRGFAVEAALILGMFVFGLIGFIYQRRLSEALERRIGQQEEFMASILQSSLDAIIFVDTENRVKVWNRGAQRIFGYTAEEMVGQTFHRLIPPGMAADEELERIEEEARTKGYVRDYIAPRITKDGSRITIDISRTAVFSAEGELIGSTVIIRDVTEKMEYEQRIYNTEKLASIGNLAAGVAHEINNPLAIILGFTDLLLERFEKGSSEHEDLTVIADNANNARKIVENLLGFARITEGLEDTVDVNHGIQTVVNIIKNTLMTAKVELAVDVPEELPRVCGDAREFQQVIFNLINNAVAAMRETGGTLTLAARAEKDSVHVSVTDTGPGIPDKIKRRIFDPFFTTKKVGEGTGLGLSLCYGILKKYGGKIAFTSRAREDHPVGPWGTTFQVSMPVCELRQILDGAADDDAPAEKGGTDAAAHPRRG